jgi:hypothetical protein
MGLYLVRTQVLSIYPIPLTPTSHLLVTHPTKSRALESFVVDIAKRSTHIALIVRQITPLPHLSLLTASVDLMVPSGRPT